MLVPASPCTGLLRFSFADCCYYAYLPFLNAIEPLPHSSVVGHARPEGLGLRIGFGFVHVEVMAKLFLLRFPVSFDA